VGSQSASPKKMRLSVSDTTFRAIGAIRTDTHSVFQSEHSKTKTIKIPFPAPDIFNSAEMLVTAHRRRRG